MPAELNLAPQLLAEKKRVRRRYLILVIALAILLGLGLASKPIYHTLKSWRSRQLATRAEGFLREQKWDMASADAVAAYQLAPSETSAIRVVARLQSRTGHPGSALGFWQQLQTAHVMTKADLRDYAEDLLRNGQLVEARQQVESLLGGEAAEPATLRLGARIFAAAGAYDRSLDLAVRAQQIEPQDRGGKLLLGLLQMESQQAATHDAGFKSILQLAREKDQVALDAQTYLAHRRDLPAETAREIASLLKARPLTDTDHRLLALDVELALNPGARRALLGSAMAEYQAAEPGTKRAFAVWLNAHREYDLTLQLVPLAQALERKDLLLVHLDALAASKRWSEIEQILEGKRVPLDETYSQVFLARSAMELGKFSQADLHWRRAHIIAAPSPEQMWFLASYAEKIGQTDQAELAYRSLASSATTARPSYEALLRLAEKKGETQTMLDLLREMAGRWPNDPAIRNDCAYFNLLTGQDIDSSLRTAQQLVVRTPASFPHRTTLALAYLRKGDTASALKVYDGLNIPWDLATAGQAAVHVAALGMNGLAADARKQAAVIRVEQLRAEERALIHDWLAPDTNVSKE